MELIMEDVIAYQKRRLLKLAQSINASVTEEDILQPFDFRELETSPEFRYEEGVLHGMLSMKAALLVKNT